MIESKKKVISIQTGYCVNDNRVIKECVSLKKHGFEPTLFGTHTGNLKEYEIVNDIPLYRIKLKTKFLPKSKIFQIFKLIEYFFRVRRIEKNVDIVHCNDWDILPVGLLFKLFNRKTKIVYDAHEYETERLGMSKSEKKVVRFIEKFSLKHVSRVITVSDSIANEYVKLYNIHKPALVLNTPDLVYNVGQNNIFRKKYSIPESTTIFLYQGGFSAGRGIPEILNVFCNKANNKDVVVVFMGNGGKYFNLVIESANKYKKVFYHPAVSQNDLVKYTSSADYGLLLYENNCLNHYYCSPNKLFEYINAEIPIIANNLHEVNRIISINNIGYTININQDKEFENFINDGNYKQKEFFKRALKDAKLKYNWVIEEKKLVNIYLNEIGK